MNGLKIEWGRTTGNTHSATFPTSFSSAPNVVALGMRSNGEHRVDNLILNSVSTSGFTFSWFDHGSDYTIFYIAIGY